MVANPIPSTLEETSGIGKKRKTYTQLLDLLMGANNSLGATSSSVRSVGSARPGWGFGCPVISPLKNTVPNCVF